MPSPQYTLIQSHEITGSSQSSVTLSGIPQDYRHLYLAVSAKCDAAAAVTSMNLRPNNTTDTVDIRAFYFSNTSRGNFNVDYTYMETYGLAGAGATANYWGHIEFDFFDYSQTDRHKVAHTREGQHDYGGHIRAQRWNSTAAITSLTMFPSSGQFLPGSNFYLWGVN